MAGLLERAREAFASHGDEKVLQRLLEAWEVTRAERIALLAEQLSALAATRLTPARGLLGAPQRLKEFVKQAHGRNSWVVGRELREYQDGPADPRLTPGLLELAALPLARKQEVAGSSPQYPTARRPPDGYGRARGRSPRLRLADGARPDAVRASLPRGQPGTPRGPEGPAHAGPEPARMHGAATALVVEFVARPQASRSSTQKLPPA